MKVRSHLAMETQMSVLLKLFFLAFAFGYVPYMLFT